MRPPQRASPAARGLRKTPASRACASRLPSRHFCQFLFAFSREHHNQPRSLFDPHCRVVHQQPHRRRAQRRNFTLANRACLRSIYSLRRKLPLGVSRSPFSWCSFQRRSARTSGEASRKICSSALGKTTVPMSRPSITTPPPAPARCCSATSTSRTPCNRCEPGRSLRHFRRTNLPCNVRTVKETQFFAPAASVPA